MATRRGPGGKGAGGKGAGGKGGGRGRRGPSAASRGAPAGPRPAIGRERERFFVEKEPLWLRVALDALARHRAAREPLDRVLEHGFRSARLGPRERRRAGDVVFAWARARARLEGIVAETLAATGGVMPPTRERDRAGLALAALASNLEPVPAASLPDPLAGLLEEAEAVGVGALARGASGPLPGWLRRRLEERYGEGAPALEQALTEAAPIALAFDPRHLTREDLLEALEALDVQAEPSAASPTGVRVKRRFSLARLPKKMRPHVWPMDDGSQAVVHALGVTPGELVLDLCAGGGGKARLLLALGARVVVADLDRSRLAAAVNRTREAGRSAAVLADGRRAPFLERTFAKVLVDAPCTGTGTLRRAPDLAARLAPADVPPLCALQHELLAGALPLLSAGGRLVYATCSLLPEENEGALEVASGDVRVQSTHTFLPSVEGTDGFFVAVLERRP